jgi:ATP-dependent helicase/nuclease subunit A
MRMTSEQPSLFTDVPEAPPGAPAAAPVRVVLSDAAARAFAVDPRNHVVLEASAGTGKTSVLVHRYLNLLRAGADPSTILAITFTRKAAAEMRERIVGELAAAAARGEIAGERWRNLREQLPDIAISTIDAFCLSLLREFPLEADLDPGFDLVDETEVPRLVDETLDRAIQIARGVAATDPDVALVFAHLKAQQVHEGLSHLLARRLVAPAALNDFLRMVPAGLTDRAACQRAAGRVIDALESARGGILSFLEDGPVEHARYQILLRDIHALRAPDDAGTAAVRAALDRIRDYFLTLKNTPRKTQPYSHQYCSSRDASRRHGERLVSIAPLVREALAAFDRDMNAVLARGVRRMLMITLDEYRRTMESHAVLDFSEVLARALALLDRMEEFSQSRFRLESRYQHVLLDEFQDTSRAQWDLVKLLVRSWGEGFGVGFEGPLPPSIFIVGDRKQSIYRFRDADVSVVDEAGSYVEQLRPGAPARRAISHSFRAVPELLAFTNDLFAEVEKVPARPDAFRFADSDRFPLDEPRIPAPPALGIAAAGDLHDSAAAVAAEIRRLLEYESVRDRQTGVPRPARPGDIAILFRSRESHRDFEQALEAEGIPTYVYKGLGFFDADEIQDVSALMRYLADPSSDLRAAAFLRSRLIRLSDPGLALLASESIARALLSPAEPAGMAAMTAEDRDVLGRARRVLPRWIALVDRVPPVEVVDLILDDTAYAFELRGPRRLQAWENLKKFRALIRRIQNRGYTTLARIADHIEELSAGDESNAVLDALDAVNLMTVHASKGLEFPVVFVVNLARGTSGRVPPIRILLDSGGAAGPSVNVGPKSETDEPETRREREETKRLLYVAVTRARDRLYLASVVKDGAFRAGSGSLAEVAPASLGPVFVAAGAAPPELPSVTWEAASGARYPFWICRVPDPVPDKTRWRAQDGATATVDDDFGPLQAPSATAFTATGIDAESALNLHLDRPDHPSSDPEARIVGSLVHRLFQSAGAAGDELDGLRTRVEAAIRPDERAIVDTERVAARATDVYRAMRARRDLAELFERGAALFEVPFSLELGDADTLRRALGDVPPATVIRGTIDCLVLCDGEVTVLEFKTGIERHAHARQLAIYEEAARRLFPSLQVTSLLVYPDSPDSPH